MELLSPSNVCESPLAIIRACLTIITDAATRIEDGLQIGVSALDISTDGKILYMKYVLLKYQFNHTCL